MMRHLTAIAAATLLTACSVQLPNPRVQSVEPNAGWNGAPTPVQILGDHFYPRVEVDTRRAEDRNADKEFRAWLVGPDGEVGEERLAAVNLVSYNELAATVQSGLSPGLYDLRVAGPTGLESTFKQAFRVKDVQADHFAFIQPEVSWPVLKQQCFEVRLQDQSDAPVLENLDVSISVTDADGNPAPVEFPAPSMPPEFVVVDDHTIQGPTGLDGYVYPCVKVLEPMVVELRADPVNGRSGVAGDTHKGEVTPGDEREVIISLPGSQTSGGVFQAVAGQPFTATLKLVDETGFVVNDGYVVDLLNQVATCGGWAGERVEWAGETTVDVTLTSATNTTNCVVDFLQVLNDDARSIDIAVAPAAADHFLVEPLGTQEAGSSMTVLVQPLDQFNNETAFTGASIDLSDSLGAQWLDVCTGPQVGSAVTRWTCVIPQVTGAGTGITLTATGNSITGTSAPYDVRPAAPDALVVTAPVVVQAGTDFPVVVEVIDAFGNRVDAATYLPSLAVTDPGAEVVCQTPTVGTDGLLTVDCGLTTAVTGTQLDIDLASLSASSGLFDVQNGALAQVTLTPQAATVQAGIDLLVDLLGADAFGNPYKVGPKDLALFDTSGTVAPVTATLGSSGTMVSVPLRFTKAGATSVSATAAGDVVVLGTSPTIVVEPAGAVTLTVDVDAPWIWVSSPTEVQVEAKDTFGNRADYDGTATVSSDAGAAVDLDITLANGIGTGQLNWTVAALSEFLDASTAGGLNGRSAELLVVQQCGVTGPTPDMSFGGFPDAVVCWDDTTESADIAVAMTGSVQGGAPIATYAVSTGEQAVRNNIGVFNPVTLDTLGVHDVLGLVVQTDGCANAIAARAYVGEDDGNPVGPITVRARPGDESIVAQLETARIDVSGGVDCSRDIAVGGLLWVRSDRGDLTGLTATGTGLALQLDSAGAGSFVLSAVNVASGGVATLTGWTPSQAVEGDATVQILGDNQAPEVWDQTPTGDDPALISEVTLTFSEPLLTSTIDLGYFDVTGPGAVLQSVAQVGNGDQVVLTLQSPVDGTAGAYSVFAATDIRDVGGGNLLDGGWSGSKPFQDYVGAFGDLPGSVEAIDSCAAAAPRFRPDGDDGLAEEADTVAFAIDSTDAPAWWMASVFDGSTLVRRDWLTPVGAQDSWTWDGRDEGGRVLDNGNYTVSFEPMDAVGNRGVACQTTVVIDNAAEGG